MRQKPARKGRRRHGSALTGFHAGVLLVDNVNPAATPYDTAIFIAHLGRFQAVSDFHGPSYSADALMELETSCVGTYRPSQYESMFHTQFWRDFFLCTAVLLLFWQHSLHSLLKANYRPPA
jgi:hypothetical protein